MESVLIPGLLALAIAIGLKAAIRSVIKLRVIPPHIVLLGGLICGVIFSQIAGCVSGAKIGMGGSYVATKRSV